MSDKAQKILISAMLLGSLVACSPREDNGDQDEEQPTTEVPAQDPVVQNDPYGNIALFEASRRKIKFSLAFVENFYDYTFYCGKWAKGYGITVVYDENGKGRDVVPGETCTMASANIDIERYLTFSSLKSIREDVKVPLDENTLLAACVIQYCIGPSRFRNSYFLEALNNGAKGEELVKWLTIYRKDPGVVKRCYFFAAMVCGKMEFSDLLDVCAGGCYNLWQSDILRCRTTGRTDNIKNIKKDADNCGIWNFDNLQQNLATVKKPATEYVTIALKPKKKTKKHECQFVKDIVPDSIWNDVSNGRARIIEIPQDIIVQQMSICDQYNDTANIAYMDGDYETALQFAEAAYKIAQTNKEIGASTYNIGMAYLAMGKYERAVRYLKKSYEVNPTADAKKALDEAIPKRNANRCWAGGGMFLGVLGLEAKRRRR
jgi:GH24 family phage-related lysozyme (muramidase)